MKIPYNWLQEYFEEKLPSAEKVADLLNTHSFEVEGLEEVDGQAVIEVDILNNRAHDCMGLDGIAKDLSAILDTPLKNTRDRDKVSQEDWSDKIEGDALRTVVIEDTRCTRYQGVEIKNIQNEQTPDEIRTKLEALGEKSISLIVDLTNIVMFETGQPMHAFDTAKLSGNISVRSARSGEEMQTLDGTPLELTEDDMVIADEKNTLALAGIKGGVFAGVTLETKDIFLEAANFKGGYVRAGSARNGITTESSKRFQHSLSPVITQTAVNRFLEYVNVYFPEAKIMAHTDIYPKKIGHYKVGVSLGEVNSLLGSSLTEKDMKDIFEKLDFKNKFIESPRETIVELAKEQIGKPYKSGSSVLNEGGTIFDCSSLSSWLYVQSGISIPRMVIDQTVFLDEVSEENLKPGDLIISNTNRFIHKTVIEKESCEFMQGTPFPDGADHLGVYVGDGEVIHATCREEADCVIKEQYEDSESFGEKVVKFATYNNVLDTGRFVVSVPDERLDIRRKEDLIEEIGRIYGYDNIPLSPVENIPGQDALNSEYLLTLQIKEVLINEGFSEIYMSSFVKKGDLEVAKPAAKDRPSLRTTMVTGMEQALEKNKTTIDLQSTKDLMLFEIGKVFIGTDETLKLSLGVRKVQSGKKFKPHEVLRDICEKLEKSFGVIIPEIRDQQEIVEIDLSQARVLPGDNYPKFYVPTIKEFSPISVYPYMVRDLAVWIPGDESQESLDKLQKIILENSGDLLVKYELFDTFTKDDDGEKRTSYAYRMVYQSHERTLEEGEVTKIMDSIYKEMSEQAGWEIR